MLPQPRSLPQEAALQPGLSCRSRPGGVNQPSHGSVPPGVLGAARPCPRQRGLSRRCSSLLAAAGAALAEIASIGEPQHPRPAPAPCRKPRSQRQRKTARLRAGKLPALGERPAQHREARLSRRRGEQSFRRRNGEGKGGKKNTQKERTHRAGGAQSQPCLRDGAEVPRVAARPAASSPSTVVLPAPAGPRQCQQHVDSALPVPVPVPPGRQHPAAVPGPRGHAGSPQASPPGSTGLPAPQASGKAEARLGRMRPGDARLSFHIRNSSAVPGPELLAGGGEGTGLPPVPWDGSRGWKERGEAASRDVPAAAAVPTCGGPAAGTRERCQLPPRRPLPLPSLVPPPRTLLRGAGGG